jgi:hypothetical protein
MAILMHTNKPKILIPEKVSPDGLALLKDQFEVDEKKGLSPEELKSIIGDYEALIVRSETKVTADLLNAAKKLKVIDPSLKPSRKHPSDDAKSESGCCSRWSWCRQCRCGKRNDTRNHCRELAFWKHQCCCRAHNRLSVLH